MSKGKLTALILCLMLAMPLGAASRGSEFIDLDSGFYEDFDSLASSLGMVVSRTRPYTKAEAMLYLEEAGRRPMNQSQRAVYEHLVEEADLQAGDDVFTFNFSGAVNPQVHAHLDRTFSDQAIEYTRAPDSGEVITAPGSYSYSPFNLYSSWPGTEVKDFIDIDMAVNAMDNITLFFQLPVANVRHTKSPFGSQYFMTNIPMLADPLSFQYEDFNMNFPYRAHLSAGGSWWSLLIGRDKFDYGGGISGNLAVDRHLDYHNALSLSFFSKTFKYTFFLSFLPHPSQYIVLDDSTDSSYGYDLAYDQEQDAFTGTKVYVSHRFEWTSRTQKSRIALSESVMYQNDDGGLDFQFLNPMLFLHNLYTAGNANSLLSLEWEYAFTEGVTQNISLLIDDLNVPGEKESDGDNTKPSALGFQYNIRTSHPVGQGIITSFAEVTLTSDSLYLYLREDAGTGTPTSYPIDFTTAVRNMRTGTGVYDVTYLGYPYGGGVINALAGLGWQVPGAYSISGSFNYIMKKNLTPFTRIRASVADDSPVMHSFITTLNASWHVTSDLELSPSLTYVHVLNYGHDADDNRGDVQLAIGASYRF